MKSDKNNPSLKENHKKSYLQIGTNHVEDAVNMWKM